ncbi:leukocyte immunoglobulin-like receptor subfamily B member 2 isoform X2 [Zalophus californianus]|uniref:Leukocyte immunoglobulin-like receptor subfamily B member 2 isoform X2 n=1 Tax=Zalophus californianus TaxID=9704 RepID=A0A6P9F1I1_ZALCA|nr:leukocyte immunoglobulin-like receptor subfamily B member 2 isoform X2 [Zalophus californianus]
MGGSAGTLTPTALLYLGLCQGLWDQAGTVTLPKPSIWADPGPMVTKGSPVTIWCQASLQADVYYLYKESVYGSWPVKTSQDSSNRASFSFASISSHNSGKYQCAYQRRKSWSQGSDLLTLVVTGVYREPSLSAQPGSLVQSGDSLTLLCRSETGFDRFALTKDEELRAPQRLDGQPSPNFTLGPVSRSHGGQYRCYCGHKLSSTWSAPSAPLDVLITGMYEKPTLSAQPGPSVSWGENVTLQCRSEVWFDSFHLSKEGSLAPPQVLHLQDTAIPYQVKFTLSPVTSDHEGTYRCYSSHSNSPYLLSQPSDPLELLVSGPHWYLYVLIGVSVAFVLLLGLLGLLLVRHRRRGKGRKPAVSAKVSEDRGLHGRPGPAATAQEESLYAVMEDTPPEEDRQLDSQFQAAVSDDPQDVTYAQLNYLTLTRETGAPPSSQPGEPPDEPNAYASLALR